MKGWIKIKGCCEQAIEEDLNYAVSSFEFLLASLHTQAVIRIPKRL